VGGPQFTADPHGAFRRDAENLDCIPPLTQLRLRPEAAFWCFSPFHWAVGGGVR
jgi:hypothetical protein